MNINNNYLNVDNPFAAVVLTREMDQFITCVSKCVCDYEPRPKNSTYFSKKVTHFPSSFALIKRENGEFAVVIYLQSKKVIPGYKIKSGIMGFPFKTFFSVTILSSIEKTGSAFVAMSEQLNNYTKLKGTPGLISLFGNVLRFPADQSYQKLDLIFPHLIESVKMVMDQGSQLANNQLVATVARGINAIEAKGVVVPIANLDTIFRDAKNNLLFTQFPVEPYEPLLDASDLEEAEELEVEQPVTQSPQPRSPIRRGREDFRDEHDVHTVTVKKPRFVIDPRDLPRSI